MCCTRRFASCLGPRIYRLLVARNRGGPLTFDVWCLSQSKMQQWRSRELHQLLILQVPGDFARWDIPWPRCRQPVTAESFNAMAAAAKAAAQAGHWPCGVLGTPLDFSHSDPFSAFVAFTMISIILLHVERSKGFSTFSWIFWISPWLLEKKTNILWALQKRADMLQLHRPYHYCQAAPGMNIVARVSDRWSQPISAVGGVLERVYVKFELIMMVGYHGFCWFMIDHQSVAFSILTTRFKFDRG